MGRGRAKAKQQKVARELKYSSPSTDYSALERELGGSPPEVVEEEHDDDDGDTYSYPYEDDEYDTRRR